MKTTWPTVGLHDICRPKQWKTITSAELTSDGYLVYGANGVIGYYHSYNHETPTILVGCRGSCGSVTVSEPKSWVTGNAMALDELDTSVVDFSYLICALRADGLASAVTGTSQPQITQTSLRRIRIPLPSIEEQRRIAAILDAADALRTKRRQAQAKLDSLTQAIFADMFGDPVLNDRSWTTLQLSEVAEGIFDCPHSTPVWTEHGQICLRTSNLGRGIWDWTDKRFVSAETFDDRSRRAHLKPDDIILSREGTVGIAALVPFDVPMCMGQRLVQVRSNQHTIRPRFLLDVLLFLLAPDRIGRVMAGSTSRHLNVKELRLLRIIVPPLELQDSYVVVANCGGEAFEQMNDSADQIDALFASLQDRAFRGEL